MQFQIKRIVIVLALTGVMASVAFGQAPTAAGLTGSTPYVTVLPSQVSTWSASRWGLLDLSGLSQKDLDNYNVPDSARGYVAGFILKSGQVLDDADGVKNQVEKYSTGFVFDAYGKVEDIGLGDHMPEWVEVRGAGNDALVTKDFLKSINTARLTLNNVALSDGLRALDENVKVLSLDEKSAKGLGVGDFRNTQIAVLRAPYTAAQAYADAGGKGVVLLSDGTPDRAKALAQEYPRVTVVAQYPTELDLKDAGLDTSFLFAKDQIAYFGKSVSSEMKDAVTAGLMSDAFHTTADGAFLTTNFFQRLAPFLIARAASINYSDEELNNTFRTELSRNVFLVPVFTNNQLNNVVEGAAKNVGKLLPRDYEMTVVPIPIFKAGSDQSGSVKIMSSAFNRILNRLGNRENVKLRVDVSTIPSADRPFFINDNLRWQVYDGEKLTKYISNGPATVKNVDKASSAALDAFVAPRTPRDYFAFDADNKVLTRAPMPAAPQGLMSAPKIGN